MLFFKNKVYWRNLKALPTLVVKKRIMLRSKRKNFLMGNYGQEGRYQGQAMVSDDRCYLKRHLIVD